MKVYLLKSCYKSENKLTFTIISIVLLTLVFAFLTGCSTSTYTPTNVEEKVTIPSKKNTITAVNPKTYSSAYQQFYDRATKGDPVAEYNLGHMYSDGRGVSQDSKQAIYWFKKAAQHGNTNAMVSLGMAYQYGRGVRKSKRQACQYFQQASSEGNREGKNFWLAYCNARL